MKNEPTDIDREAARLFAVAQGMRVQVSNAQDDALVRVDWCRVAESTWAGGLLLHRMSSSQVLASYTDIIAFDTDDPATVGCMLAQVEQAANHTLSEVADNGEDHRRPERRHAVMVWSARANCERHEADGPTRGAALVGAMRQIKEESAKETKT